MGDLSIIDDLIEPPEGGKTVAEIFQQKDELDGKPVLVRGVVTKVSNHILGRNWVHLQDGTGAPGANDLTVTTEAVLSVGDTVTVKGTLALNRDFGAGYQYDLLLESAEVQGQQ